MKKPEVFNETVSRRSFLKGGALLASIAVVSATGAMTKSAYAGVPKAAVQYVGHPDGDKECSNCIQYLPGANTNANGTCKLVDGDISPRGYCAAYSRKT